MVPAFIMSRGMQDRRDPLAKHPPYMTEEGFVMVDRRVQGERRAGIRLPQPQNNLEKVPVQSEAK